IWWLFPSTRAVAGAVLALTGVLQLIGGAIISVLPLPFLPFEPDQSLHHYLSHAAFGLAQIPLLWFRGEFDNTPKGVYCGDTPMSTAFTVLPRWFRWRDAPNLLRQELNQQAFRFLDEREAHIATLQSAGDWQRRQVTVRQKLEELLGPFPERTPLNARVTGTVQRRGFRVEKIVFESRPSFYVTACLFLPEPLSASVPAILNPIGHTDIAFRAESYQTLILNLVRKGFAVFAFDPPGQGERLQYFDPEYGESRVGSSTREHSYVGRQCFLTGRSSGHYFAWDGIRAIDYLLTRPEIDPQRIGVTGISGGGTQAAYIAALDERVVAAAPTCYITSFRRLLESIGPQDAEQNLLRGLAAGIDHADYLEVRAPKPALVVATTRDFFSIQGARETSAEVARAYEALGAPEAFAVVEDDHGHGYTSRTREAIYRFFQRALDLPGDSADEPVDYLRPEELTVTETGQVSTSLGGEAVFSLNRAEAVASLSELRARRDGLAKHFVEVREHARRLSGYRAPDQADAHFLGRSSYGEGGACAIEQIALRGDGDCVIPAVVLVPPRAASGERCRAAIVCHPQGKSAAASPDGVALTLVRRGWIVLVPDLSQTGELAPRTGDREVEFEPILLGRSLPGIRAGEITHVARYLLARDDTHPEGLLAVASGELGPALLHAALFDESIAQVALLEAPLSWQGVALHRYYKLSLRAVVPGALPAYDLPDIAAALAPRRLLALNPTDHQNRPLSQEQACAEWEVVTRAYAHAGADAQLTVAAGVSAAEGVRRLSQFFGTFE
ncbi:MAG TPA: alpha/beta fold hydrolase, partial [Chloroflexota bacterium]|nr:alpha/beta fold hydrolase [Chloroflexota bacterium]